MSEAEIRKYAGLMQELGLTGLEITQADQVVRLERNLSVPPAAASVIPVPAAPANFSNASSLIYSVSILMCSSFMVISLVTLLSPFTGGWPLGRRFLFRRPQPYRQYHI